ncbi:MAG: phage/plasmid primase, P4 family, partial [Desulfobaccales bacterium]
DDTGEVARRAKDTARQIHNEANNAVDDDHYKAILKWALRSEAENRLGAMIDLARSEPGIPVLPEDLDADPWLLAVANGALDLRQGSVRPAAPADLLTRLAPVAYDPAAQAPTWERFLADVMDGDREMISFLQRAIGYSLTGDTREQVIFFLHGVGANGKSTFLDALGAMLGDYSCNTPTETLMTRAKGAIPNDVARLRGARFVTAIEAEEGQRIAEVLLKQLTGGDVVSARFMRAEWFDFRPEFKIWLATNHKPIIRGADHAIWRRIRLVPFEVTFPDEFQDRDLPAKLRAELPGILAWAVRGCLEWQRTGLGVPDKVRAATADYRSEMDVLTLFLDDCCLVKPTAQAKAGALYSAYEAWCQANGERAMAKRSFGLRLGERGLVQDKGTGGTRLWRGLGLLSDPEQLDLPGEAGAGHETLVF